MNKLEDIIEKAVNDTLQEKGIDNNNKQKESMLKEAYVTQVGSFNLNTELLSSKTKKSHQELLKGYVQTLNKISASLDGADKSTANLNSSTFRALKIDCLIQKEE